VFVNRADELAQLEHWWTTARRPGLLWGRRRVGKTALLQHFARSRRTVWHTAAGRPAAAELALLSRTVAGTEQQGLRDGLAKSTPGAWWSNCGGAPRPSPMRRRS